MSISQNPGTTTTARRHFLGQSAAGLAVAALPLTSSAVTNLPATASLDRAKWSARNHAALSTLIKKNGSSSPNYDAKRKPYAVFDWDNTAIMNDTEEALFMYQINTLGFRLSPPEFAAIIRQNVPAGPFSADYNNNAGKAVTLEDLADSHFEIGIEGLSPFTAPQDEFVDVLKNVSEEDIFRPDSPLAMVKAKAYDLVINGYECGGGSIRIHSPEVQSRMFAMLGMSPEQAQGRRRGRREPPTGGPRGRRR
mgnify:CR=1 FL=1